MSDRKRKASSSEEPVCVLCRRVDVDPNICGDTLSASGIYVHKFCLTFANIVPHGMRIEDVPPAVITRAVKQANQKQCFVCGERGAAISCAESGCERSFHLPCAMDGECVTQYFNQHRSYCWEHRPSQEIEEAPAEGTNCLICFEPVGDTLSYHTMLCSACTHAWFHRGCIQQLALNAGALSFQCPNCRNIERFFRQMIIHGIHIPLRPPSWEANNAYASLQERHRRCDVSNCLNPGGREQVETRG
ncbi:PHD finger protein 7-like [Lagopus muta]|uniref:PHD finger protein 7-like n=1 Tax=Lagopus muta TaxID=64668 RepID=UPI00209DA3ED|nr:PHD finger protein 7-like [Lagopus muta]